MHIYRTADACAASGETGSLPRRYFHAVFEGSGVGCRTPTEGSGLDSTLKGTNESEICVQAASVLRVIVFQGTGESSGCDRPH